jgi:hypothetical protein
MNAKAWAKLETLAAACAETLRDKNLQSLRIYRGDMWAVVGAHHDLRKAREKVRAVDAVDPVAASDHEPTTRV